MNENQNNNSRSGIGFFIILLVIIITGVLVLKMCKPSKKKSNISQQENQIPESTEMKEPEIVQEQSTEQSVSTEDFITGKVYFCRILENGTQRILTAFRKIPTDNSLEHALKALLSGPTEAEASHDIVTNIPENTMLKSIKIENNIMFLDFSTEFEFNSFGRESTVLQLKQIVFTATEYTDIKQIQFLIDGQIRTYLGGDGVFIGKPLSRDDFS
jgi:spore germination protein GerM